MRTRDPEILDEDQWDEIVRSVPGARRRSLFRRVLRGLFFTGMLFLVMSLIAGGIYFMAQRKANDGQLDVATLEDQKSGGPMNVLVLGSDSRAGLSKEDLKKYDPTGKDRNSGRRADTIILLHIDPDRQKAIMLSFPRDLRVRYPDGKVGKINAAYQKGPDAMVETVSSYTGIPIHHYVDVNFASFKNIVNTLGGVDVYFERPIRERDSGLNVPRGCVRIEGDQALAFVRVRKIDSDFGRIERQQLFVKLMMDKLTKKGTLLNPVKIAQLVDIFAKNVTTDTELSPGTMQTLAKRLRGFNSGDVEMRLVPGRTKTISGVSYVLAEEEQAQALFQALRDGTTLPDYGRTGVSPIDPQEINVAVLNGSGTPGVERKEAEKLAAEGFPRPAFGSASPHRKTTVYFKEGNTEKAKTVAARYGAVMKEMPATIEVDSELAVVLGADFPAGKATPAPPAPATGGKAPPEAKPLIHECPGSASSAGQ